MPPTARRSAETQHAFGNFGTLSGTGQPALCGLARLIRFDARNTAKPTRLTAREVFSKLDPSWPLLVRLGLEAFLLHLAQHVAHILHLVPDILAHVNGSLLLRGHGDAVARAAVQFDNLLLQFVLDA